MGQTKGYTISIILMLLDNQPEKEIQYQLGISQSLVQHTKRTYFSTTRVLTLKPCGLRLLERALGQLDLGLRRSELPGRRKLMRSLGR